MGVKGESLPNVHYAINYLKSPELYERGKHVVVIGGGNVAMDVARSAIRSSSTHEVTVLYRRGEENMSCSKEEYAYTKMDGVDFIFHAQAEEFTEEGVIYYDTREENAERQFLACDSIMVSISQGPQTNVVSTEHGISLNEKGLVKTDENLQTTMPCTTMSKDYTILNGWMKFSILWMSWNKIYLSLKKKPKLLNRQNRN